MKRMKMTLEQRFWDRVDSLVHKKITCKMPLQKAAWPLVAGILLVSQAFDKESIIEMQS